MRSDRKHSAIIFLLILFFCGALVLSGCNTPDRISSGSTATSAITEEPAHTETPEATATPDHIAYRTILVASPSGNQGILEQFRNALNDLPEGTVIVEEKETLTPDQLSPEIKLVIFTENPENLSDFIQKVPETQFLTVATENRGDPNVWIIGYEPSFELFMAGLFTGLTANDWRGGGMIPSDSSLYGEAAEESFSNGMRFFCGRCQSIGPPYIVYPQIVMLPISSTAQEWQSGMETLPAGPVNTWFVSDAALNSEVLQKIVNSSASLITSSAKPENWQGNWLGSVQINLSKALADILHRIENGESAAVVIPELEIQSGNQASLFNEGKSNYMKKVYQELVAGLILPHNPVPPSVFEK